MKLTETWEWNHSHLSTNTTIGGTTVLNREDGLYVELFAVKDGIRYNEKDLEVRNMHSTFTLESLHINDIVVYLKNERTGSSTIRKCKFIGHIVEFIGCKVKIHRLSPPDTFVYPDECKDLGYDTIYPDDVVHIIVSKYNYEK